MCIQPLVIDLFCSTLVFQVLYMINKTTSTHNIENSVSLYYYYYQKINSKPDNNKSITFIHNPNLAMVYIMLTRFG